MKPSAIAVLVLALGLTLTSCASSAAPTDPAKKSRIETALAACHVSSGESGIQVGDDGTSLVLDTQGDEDGSGMQNVNATCVLNATKITDADMNLVESTRALDGRQQASWNGYDATWSYHPNTGLNMTLVDTHK